MKIGFIGSGPISNFHIQALIATGFEVNAIGTRKGSKNCQQFAAKFGLLNQYCKGGWEEVIEADVDAFCICIDTSFTPMVLSKTLDKNKPIFVEKPVAWELDKVTRISQHPFSQNIFVGYNRRYYETTIKLKEYCDKAKGGTILVNIPDSTAGIRQFLNNGCHIIDILRFVAGDFEILEKSIRGNDENSDISSISALAQNKKWKILINAHSLIPSNFSISVNSEKDVFELKPIEKFSWYRGIEIREPTLEEPIRQYLPKLQHSFIENSQYKPGFIKMYNEFAAFIKNKELEHKSNLNEAITTLSYCWKLLDGDISMKFSDFERN